MEGEGLERGARAGEAGRSPEAAGEPVPDLMVNLVYPGTDCQDEETERPFAVPREVACAGVAHRLDSGDEDASAVARERIVYQLTADRAARCDIGDPTDGGRYGAADQQVA